MGAKLSCPEVEIDPERTFLVTGANTGIGYVTAKKIAQLGGRVVITCRTEEKAKETIERMQKENEAEFNGKQAAGAKSTAAQKKKSTMKEEETPKEKKAEVEDAKTEGGEGTKEEEKKENVEGENDGAAPEKEETPAEEVAPEGGKVEEEKKEEDGSETTEENAKTENADAPEAGEAQKPSAPPLNIQFMTLELGSLASVLEFIEKYKNSGLPLHVLICNAGLYLEKKAYTDDSYEQTFQVNYLSHLLITLYLLPLLKESSPNSRIVNIASGAHRYTKFALDNLQAEKIYDGGKVYGGTKLAQILNTYTLSERLKEHNIRVFAVHPGVVSTDFARNMTGAMAFLVSSVNKVGLMRSPEKGAMTSLVAALDPAYDEKTGIYFESCKPAVSSALSRNKELQDSFWKYSLECLKEHLSDDILSLIGEKLADIADDNHKYVPPPEPTDPEKGTEGTKAEGDAEGGGDAAAGAAAEASEEKGETPAEGESPENKGETPDEGGDAPKEGEEEKPL